jgi:hypothetical protein
MNERTKAIVKQVLSKAADAPHFFDFSDAQRLNLMLEMAFNLGRQSVKRQRSKRRAPNRPRGTSVQLTIQLRPQPRAVYSGRRK